MVEKLTDKSSVGIRSLSALVALDSALGYSSNTSLALDSPSGRSDFCAEERLYNLTFSSRVTGCGSVFNLSSTVKGSEPDTWVNIQVQRGRCGWARLTKMVSALIVCKLGYGQFSGFCNDERLPQSIISPLYRESNL